MKNNMEWENGQLKSLLLQSFKGDKCKLYHKGKVKELNTYPDKFYNILFE